MSITQDELLGPWLALFHTPLLSPKLSHQLLAHYGTVGRILTAPAPELRELGLHSDSISALQEYQVSPSASAIGRLVERTLDWADHDKRHLVPFADSRYPEPLKEIAVPPLLLSVQGDVDILSRPQIAIVGSRNPSVTGAETARAFARQLARCGLIVTSGMALGIDGCSHAGALDADIGTIAVMATGPDQIYPRRHKPLARQIVEQGALVTEFPIGTTPRAPYFPQRNRIISGLSLGVLVVEAAVRSGSLITAKYAMEQGREVFSIPGSIHNPMTKGCHELIRQGAKLVESVDDMLEELAPLLASDREFPEPIPDNPHREELTGLPQKILQLLTYEVTSMDLLVERSQMNIADLTPLLMQLELEGRIKSIAGGFVLTI